MACELGARYEGGRGGGGSGVLFLGFGEAAGGGRAGGEYVGCVVAAAGGYCGR